MRALLLCLLAACAAAPPTSPTSAPPATDRPELAAWLEAELAPHVPSAVVGVVERDGIVWSHASGARDGRGGATPDVHTPYRVGSVTKVLTGIAVAQQVERGALRWDMPVAELVPEVKLPGVTVRHLVTHTAGIPSMGNGSADYSKTEPSEADFLAALDAPLAFTPGSQVAYSNAGLALAGLVAARAAKQPFRALMAPLLESLGMADARWEPPPADRRAVGAMNGQLDPPTWRLGAFEPAGGLWCSASDLAGLVRFALGAIDGVLGPAAREHTFVDDPLPGHHGVAWLVFPEGVAHTGSTADYAASVAVARRRGFGVVVLVSGGAASLADCVAVELTRAIAGNRPPGSCARARPAVIDDAAAHAAFERLLSFLAAPDVHKASETFSAGFLEAVAAEKLVESAGPIGACSTYRIVERTGTTGSAELDCPGGTLLLDFALASEPPHRFAGLLIRGKK